MFCLYTLPLARPAQAKIQMLTTSSQIVTILLKSLLKSLRLYYFFPNEFMYSLFQKMLYTIVDPYQIFQVLTMRLEVEVEVLVEVSETQQALAILHFL